MNESSAISYVSDSKKHLYEHCIIPPFYPSILKESKQTTFTQCFSFSHIQLKMSSPVSQKIQHRAMGAVVVAPSFTTQEDRIMLDSLSLDGCILPPSTTITRTPKMEDADIRDYNDDYYYAPSPLACLSSIFTSAAAVQLQTSPSPPHHAIMRDQLIRSSPTRSPTTMRSFVVAEKANPMMLDCLSLDGGILPPPPSCVSSSMTMMTTANMAMTRNKKEL
jgi:hypothetical protein